MEKILQDLSSTNVRVLVVWEPILTTDWWPPSQSTLARMPDGRVRQFWDRHHLTSSELRRSVDFHRDMHDPACCVDKGFYWDVALLYAPHQTWNTTLPPPIFWEGPVVKNAGALNKTLRGLLAALP